MLKLIEIEKTYQTGQTQVEALRGVSMDVKEGDFIVIRGPSGSGKSTLLNVMGLLDSPTRGEVVLNQDIITFKDFDDLASLRSKWISFIFQSFNLNPVLNVVENVMVPLMIRKDISKKEKQKRVDEWIKHVGLEEHRLHRPEQLSGGQRQRVAIARAMVSHPRLVIADEPTASLDSVTARSILGLMQKLNDEQGVAFVFATHDPILDDFAKSTVRISDGLLESA